MNFLGLNEDTERMVASGAIAIDALVVPAGSGKIKTLPTSGGGIAFIVGKAVSAAAADLDQIEVIPCFPVPGHHRVLTGPIPTQMTRSLYLK